MVHPNGRCLRRNGDRNSIRTRTIWWPVSPSSPNSRPQPFSRRSCLGYPGGLSILKDLTKPYRIRRKEPIVRFETAPGLQAQVDFADLGCHEIDGVMTGIYLFVMVLGFSRAICVEAIRDCGSDTFLACHAHAFQAFGGMPKEILYDNAKVVATRHAKSVVTFNESLLDCAGDTVSGLACADRIAPRPKVRLADDPLREGPVPDRADLFRLRLHERSDLLVGVRDGERPQVEAANVRAVETLQHMAGFPARKTLESLDFQFQRSVNKRQVTELCSSARSWNAQRT
ncbi:MAG: DDE-type integrase/transposase/recombinase [Coriobacteriia bacterium]